MERIATIDENRLDRIIDVANENDAFKLKVKKHPDSGPRKVRY